jgi:hypothetical protein
LEHARTYVEQTSARFDLGPSNQIVEIASNDGYLLQYFVGARLPVLGIEPAANVAAAAQARIPTLVEFFGTELATAPRRGHDCRPVAGQQRARPRTSTSTTSSAALPRCLRRRRHHHGVPAPPPADAAQPVRHHLPRALLVLSFLTVSAVFAHHGVRLFDVEEIPTHGGSLRIYGCHAENAAHLTTDRAQQLLAVEREAGLDRLSGYIAFPEQVRQTKRTLVRFLLDAKESGATIAAYGAPAKGNTLLNYAGVGTDVIDFTVDRSPHKQGQFTPGTHIPICAPERIYETRPDYLLVLPWNLRDEIIEDMGAIRDWGGRFVFPIPEVSVVD